MTSKLAMGLPLLERYQLFIKHCDDLNAEPVVVFKPLTPRQLSELQLIREVSMDLQNKKDEDERKALAAAEEAAKEQEKKKNETVEEPVEEAIVQKDAEDEANTPK